MENINKNYDAIVNGTDIMVDGMVGVRAIQICEEVLRQIKLNRQGE